MMMQPDGAGRRGPWVAVNRKGLAWSSEQLAALLNARAEVVGFTAQEPHPLSTDPAPSALWLFAATPSGPRRLAGSQFLMDG